MDIVAFIKKIIYRHKKSSDSYIAYLRKKGVKIGEDVYFYSPRKTLVDEQYPWMISIGNNVRITSGVTILTHDYSWSVLKRCSYSGIKGSIVGASGKVQIGNNVFIGMNTTILRNVKIGNNVIVGCSSLVNSNCEDNSVYAGNPARKICSIKEFYQKRRSKMYEEAESLALEYKNRFGILPPREVFREYFPLFERTETALKNEEFVKVMRLMGNYEETIDFLKNNEPQFGSYEEFLKQCFMNKGGECKIFCVNLLD